MRNRWENSSLYGRMEINDRLGLRKALDQFIAENDFPVISYLNSEVEIKER